MPPTRLRSDHDAPGQRDSRTHAQQARQYAQTWYAALLAWEVETPRAVRPAVSYQTIRDHREGISTLGEFLPEQKSMLSLPNGQHLEGEVSRIINRMMLSGAVETHRNAQLLDALRDATQHKSDSLLRPDGRWRLWQISPAYALAVLSLAVTLRDALAAQYVGYVRRAYERANAEN